MARDNKKNFAEEDDDELSFEQSKEQIQTMTIDELKEQKKTLKSILKFAKDEETQAETNELMTLVDNRIRALESPEEPEKEEKPKKEKTKKGNKTYKVEGEMENKVIATHYFLAYLQGLEDEGKGINFPLSADSVEVELILEDFKEKYKKSDVAVDMPSDKLDGLLRSAINQLDAKAKKEANEARKLGTKVEKLEKLKEDKQDEIIKLAQANAALEAQVKELKAKDEERKQKKANRSQVPKVINLPTLQAGRVANLSKKTFKEVLKKNVKENADFKSETMIESAKNLLQIGETYLKALIMFSNGKNLNEDVKKQWEGLSKIDKKRYEDFYNTIFLPEKILEVFDPVIQYNEDGK